MVARRMHRVGIVAAVVVVSALVSVAPPAVAARSAQPSVAPKPAVANPTAAKRAVSRLTLDPAPVMAPAGTELSSSGEAAPAQRLSVNGPSTATSPSTVDEQTGAAAVKTEAAPLYQSGAAPAASTTPNSTKKQTKRKPIPNQYLLKVTPGFEFGGGAAAVQRLRGSIRKSLDNGMRMRLVTIDDAQAAALRSAPGVVQVWQDEEVQLADTQTSPPWGLDRIDQAALPLDSKFTYDTNGAGVNAYIIDSGIAATHTEFGPRVLAGADFSGSGNAITDCNTHGTHVAGTVGGSTYGVAKAVTLIPVRVFGCSGSTSFSTVVSAVNWVIGDHDPGEPAVANMSLGGGAYQPIDDAVAAAVADGVVMVVAAGNNGDDACNYSPARTPSAITVGATASDDTRAYFSNWGLCVDIYGPGVGVLSADANNLPSGSKSLSGTSMATPHVVGAVARLLSANPALTPADVVAFVRGSAASIAVGPLLQSPLYGGGALPPAPTGLTAVPHKNSIQLTWNAAGAGIAAFRISLSTGGFIDVGRNETSYLVEGLTNGVPVTVSLAALNAYGWSPTITANATPYDDGSPDAPVIKRLGPGDGWVAVELTMPSVPTGGVVTRVDLTATNPSGTVVTASQAVAPGATTMVVRIEGLENQVMYTVRAVAVNAVGPSTKSVAMSSKPGASIAVGSYSGSFSTPAGSIAIPAAVSNAMAVDEIDGVVWASAGASVVAMTTADHLVSTASLTEESARWLVAEETYGRVLSVPFFSGTNVKQLDVVNGAIVATNVGTAPTGSLAMAYDQTNHELIVAGTSVTRLGVGASGALTSLSVPSLSLGGASVTSVAVYGTKVVLSSMAGGWVKLWDRSDSSVLTLSGLTLPGGLFASSTGVLVGAGKGPVLTRIGWGGTVLGTVDLHVARIDGEAWLGRPYNFPTYEPFDATHVLVSVAGNLVSLATDTLQIEAMGEGFCCVGGWGAAAIGHNADGPLVASYWLTDARRDLSSTMQSSAAGDYRNAAIGVVGSTTVAAVAVQASNQFGLRVHDRPSAARNVAVTAKSGAVRVTWDEPTSFGNGVPPAWLSSIHERPFSYRVRIEPGGIEVPWNGGPLEVTASGLDPSTNYTATVDVHSAAGITPSTPVPFTPATVSGVPSPPTTVTATPISEGCVRADWSAVADATAGYSVAVIGSGSSTSAAAGVTSAELCGLHPSTGQYPEVRVRVTAIGGSGSSIPSAPSSSVRATLAPMVDGYALDTDVSPELGVVVTLTQSATALQTQARRSWLSVVQDSGVRTIPLPPRVDAIVGFDTTNNAVFLGQCALVPAVFRLSLSSLELTQIPMPAGGPWDGCESMYDPARRVIWVSPTTSSPNNPFRTTGGAAMAFSVDSPYSVVATTPLLCAKPEWVNSTITMPGSPRFMVSRGRVYAKCAANNASGYPMSYYKITDMATGSLVADSNTWIDIVGTASDGSAVVASNTGVSVLGATTRTATFAADLGWQSYVLGAPFADETNRFAKATRMVGNRVLVQSANYQVYNVDLDALTSTVSYSPFFPWFTVDGPTTITAYSLSNVQMSNGATSVYPSTFAPSGSLESSTYVGQRITGLIQFNGPSTVQTVASGDVLLTGMVRSVDNVGIATDEQLMTVLYHLRPPSKPTNVSVTSNTVTWGASTTTPVSINAGTVIQPIPANSYEAADSAAAVQCTGLVYTCTKTGAFAGGGSVTAVQTAVAGSAFARSEAAGVSGSVPLSVVLAGAGTGTVTSNVGGIACGATCGATYTPGASVTLTAAASAGSGFIGWSGACSGSLSTCTVTMSQARSVTATFALVFNLSIIKAGAGSGRVLSSLVGIDCGTSCSKDYSSTETVTLSATAATGSTFAGWSGEGCSGTDTCVVTMSQARNVTATFRAARTLTVAKAGTGSGTVASADAGIDCGVACTAQVELNTSLTLTATAATGSTFTGWSGDCTGTGSCVVSMSQARSVTATFQPVFSLGVALSGAGTGKVVASVGGLDCGSSCSVDYVSGTSVTLTASATTDSVFTGWSGDCTGASLTCVLSMSAARGVTATFVPLRLLSVARAGTGSGTVTSNVGGISCGTACSTSFASGASVTLTAAAASGSVFTGWSGDCSGTSLTCSLVMSQARSATASFSPAFTASVTKSGSGTVTSDVSGINCGSTCSAPFASGTTVTLTAVAATGYVFSGWSGSCTGTGTCVLAMSAARSVTATFTAQYLLTAAKSGAGSGTVTSNVGGVNCGVLCTAYFNSGTKVTLTAAASLSPASRFTGWSGSCSGTTTTCTVTMSGARTATATFALLYTLAVTVSGPGSVSSNPTGISCGTTCSANFVSGASVTLTASASSGRRFTGWSGGVCSGTSTRCTVSMSQARSVTATFA